MSNIPILFNDAILKGRICGYCEVPTKLVDSKVIYGKSYGWAYLCPQCGAYVGCHKGTKKSLGRVANETLRQAKGMAHAYFDKLWKKRANQSKRMTKGKARSKAYAWLSDQMGTDPEYTHIGMFTEEQCLKVIELCKPYL